jgi:hypothetical protein
MTKFQIKQVYQITNILIVEIKKNIKNGDTVFALYVDMDNNTIILATKYITDDSKLEKYVYEINKKCSYSDNGRPTCGVDPALNIKKR